MHKRIPPDSVPETIVAPTARRSSPNDYVALARPDHWVKNVFVLPGTIVALSLDPSALNSALPLRLFMGLAAVCLISSSNYVLNEVLDGQFDREHPSKRNRPVPSGRVDTRLAYWEWLVLMLVGIGLSALVSIPFLLTMLALWVMGCVYNVRPLRTKEIPYMDVLTEAINNPLRMLAGWYITATMLRPPVSLLISYWMIGCYFMAIKRYAEHREIEDRAVRTAYRKSFSAYTERNLLISIMFYGAHAMLFFGAFIMRYRFELILAFPLVALVMAVYLSLAFDTDGSAQRPELLYREPRLMASVIVCAVAMLLLLFIDIPALEHVFQPSTQEK